MQIKDYFVYNFVLRKKRRKFGERVQRRKLDFGKLQWSAVFI